MVPKNDKLIIAAACFALPIATLLYLTSDSTPDIFNEKSTGMTTTQQSSVLISMPASNKTTPTPTPNKTPAPGFSF